MGLSCKFLQVNPEGEIPSLPPDSDFVGDSIEIEVSVAPDESGAGYRVPGV